MGKSVVKIPRDLLKWLLVRAKARFPGIEAPADILDEWERSCAKWDEAVNILHPRPKGKPGRPRSKTDDGYERNVKLAEIFQVLESEGHKPMDIYRTMAGMWKPGSSLWPSDDPLFYPDAVAAGKKRLNEIKIKDDQSFEELKRFVVHRSEYN